MLSGPVDPKGDRVTPRVACYHQAGATRNKRMMQKTRNVSRKPRLILAIKVNEVRAAS